MSSRYLGLIVLCGIFCVKWNEDFSFLVWRIDAAKNKGFSSSGSSESDKGEATGGTLNVVGVDVVDWI